MSDPATQKPLAVTVLRVPPEAPKPVEPPKPVPEEERVRQLAYNGATDQEIAIRLDCDVKELVIVYAHELARGRANRRIALRLMQWKQASEGSASLLVLLGKCELGQGDDPVQSQDRVIVRRLLDRDGKVVPPDSSESRL